LGAAPYHRKFLCIVHGAPELKPLLAGRPAAQPEFDATNCMNATDFNQERIPILLSSRSSSPELCEVRQELSLLRQTRFHFARIAA
jgi:hypothetical protein